MGQRPYTFGKDLPSRPQILPRDRVLPGMDTRTFLALLLWRVPGVGKTQGNQRVEQAKNYLPMASLYNKEKTKY